MVAEARRGRGLLATGTFLTTLSFLVSTPGLLAPGNDGAGFILKDLVLLGAALHVAGTSALAARASTSQAAAQGGPCLTGTEPIRSDIK